MAGVALGSHEFAAVMLVMAAMARARAWLAGLPGIRSFVRWRRAQPAARPRRALVPGPGRPRPGRRRSGHRVEVRRRGARCGGDRGRGASAGHGPAGQAASPSSPAGASAAIRSVATRRRSVPRSALWGLLSPGQVEDLRADARRQWTGCPPASRAGCGCWTARLAARPRSRSGERDGGRALAGRGRLGRSSCEAGIARPAPMPRSPWPVRGRRRGSTRAATALAGATGLGGRGLARLAPACPRRRWREGRHGLHDERLIAAGRIDARLRATMTPAASSTGPPSAPTPWPSPSTSSPARSAQSPSSRVDGRPGLVGSPGRRRALRPEAPAHRTAKESTR